MLSDAPSALYYSYTMALHGCPQDDWPNNHCEAMSCPDAAQWLPTEQLEMQTLERLQVAKLVPLLPDARLLPSRWVYTIKCSGCYKACF